MAEDFAKIEGSKQQQYKDIQVIIESMFQSETNLIANLANITAILKMQFNWFWVGFYFKDDSKNELVLGPFQGSLACTRIGKGKGVCGAAWAKGKTIIVDNVDEFPGHIACSSDSKSEIVVPIIGKNGFVALIDIDSDRLATFDSVDAVGLENICKLIGSYFD